MQKDNLLKQLFEDNLSLRELEDDILETLSSVQSDILDDQVPCSVLERQVPPFMRSANEYL